jgi:hypothetical protein
LLLSFIINAAEREGKLLCQENSEWDGGYREEAESVPPIVKSWRDAGDTPCRQNHREEAKL